MMANAWDFPSQSVEPEVSCIFQEEDDSSDEKTYFGIRSHFSFSLPYWLYQITACLPEPLSDCFPREL